MPTFDSFRAWVEGDGRELTEYGINVSRKQKTVTCWIPSEAGQKFKIHVEDSERSFLPGYTGFIDGQMIPDEVFIDPCNGPSAHERHIPMRNIAQSICFNGYRVSSSTMRPFVFTKCNYVEENTPGARADVSIGDIIVRVDKYTESKRMYRSPVKENTKEKGKGKDRCKEQGSEGNNESVDKEEKLDFPKLNIDEKGKKGLVHGIQLGDITFSEEDDPSYSASPASGSAEKSKKTARKYTLNKRLRFIRRIVKFIFKYRPLGVLQAQGIAPRPAKLPQPEEEEVSELRAEDNSSAQRQPLKSETPVIDGVNVPKLEHSDHDSDLEHTDFQKELAELKAMRQEIDERLKRLEVKKKRKRGVVKGELVPNKALKLEGEMVKTVIDLSESCDEK